LVGATGFIGGHVVEYLFQQGEISKGTFRKGSHLKIMDAYGVQGMETDLLDHNSLHEAMEGADTVYNMASPMPNVDSDFIKVDVEGVLNLLEVATEIGVKSFVHLSTLDVCGFSKKRVSDASVPHPVGEYQKAKAEAERLLLDSSKRSPLPRIVIIRAARAIGSRDESLTVPLLRMIRAGKVVLPRTGSMSLTHPLDIAQAMYKAATGRVPSGTTILLKSFDASPDELARRLIISMGVAAEVRNEGLFSKSLLPSYTMSQLKAALTIDTQPMWTGLGYNPEIGEQASCDEIANWYKIEPWATDAA
jgi:nucleoside-diphosphate-sugar epimerase